MEFEEWSNKKKEQDNFAKWGASRPPSVTDKGRRASSSYLEFWTERSEGTKYLSRNRDDEKKAAANGDLGSVGKLYGLHPGVGLVDQKAKAAQSQMASSETKIPETTAQKPYIATGQATRLGIEPTPTKPFTFWDSPKAEIPANRFSAFDAILLPGFETRTGMSPSIPPSVGTSYDNLLEATPLGAYTNIWNIEAAAPPVPSVFATMDDETLSQLITAYSDKMKKLNLQGLLESGEKSYGERTLDQLVLGNYSDDATLLGTAAQVGLGIAGLDLPMDIRDITKGDENRIRTRFSRPDFRLRLRQTACEYVSIRGALLLA